MVNNSNHNFQKMIILIQSRSYQQKTNRIIKQCHQQFSITVLVLLSALEKVYIGRPYAGLRAIHRRGSNSLPHKSRDFSVRLGLWTSHRRYDITHLLALKTPCSAYVSQDVSKNYHLIQVKFSRKMCQIDKTGFENIFIKIWIYL